MVSWSAIDYLGNWKALHYQTKRSFKPQNFSLEKEGNNYKIFFINDDFKKVKGEFKLSLLNFKGETMQIFDEEILVSENSSKKLYDFNNLIFKGISDKEAILKLELKTLDKVISKLHFFVSPKDLKLPKPNIKIKKISPTEIEISTDVLAKDIYLMGDTHFSDNFFDLLPNEKRTIKLSKALDKIEVMSLWDTMQ